MSVIPGSHRLGILEHAKSARAGNLLSINQEVPDGLVDEARAVSMPLRAGQMSLHDGMLLHGSHPNRSTRRRCGLAVRFTTPDVRQVAPELGARLLPAGPDPRRRPFTALRAGRGALASVTGGASSAMRRRAGPGIRPAWLGALASALLGVVPAGGAAGSAPPRSRRDSTSTRRARARFPPTGSRSPTAPSEPASGSRGPAARCTLGRSTCDDLRLLAELDGFDLEPRLALRFTGPIDLGERDVAERLPDPPRRGAGRDHGRGPARLGSRHATRSTRAPRRLLEPETRYGLVVTRELRDSAGRPVEPSPGFAAFLRSGGGPPAASRAPGGLRRAAPGARAARHPRGPGRGRLGLHHRQRLGVPRTGP